MPLAPHQIALLVFEIALLAGGAWLLARVFGLPEIRERLLARTRLPHWELSGPEVTLLAVSILLLGSVGQAAGHQFFSGLIKDSPQRAGLEVVVYGLGFHGVALLGWPIFWLARRALFNDYGAPPPAVSPGYREPLPKVIVHAGSALLFALPLLAFASFGWNQILRAAGISAEPQDVLAVFNSVQSPVLLAAMLFVACVLAPINEELLFRGAIFRFCRQRFGRGAALVVSGALFGVLHGNWAGFVPLALLGAVLALAYERTGDIRVSILAHGLFNLNTLAVVLSGLAQP